MKPSVLLFFSFIITTMTDAVEGECDQCQFDGNDTTDCRDYGLIDNSILVAWPIGGQECLDAYDIKIASSGGDPSLICASGNAFVNELKLGSSLEQAKQGLGVEEGGFFNEDGSLKDSITIDGQAYDCETSSTDCYDAMKDYFDNDRAGENEMTQVCDQLQNRVFNDKQLEQSTVRTRLCLESREGATISTACEALWQELESKMNEFPDKECTGFAFGVQDMVIPGCEDQTGGIGGGSGAVERFGPFLMTLLLAPATVLAIHFPGNLLQ
jgi:hypothetical protein